MRAAVAPGSVSDWVCAAPLGEDGGTARIAIESSWGGATVAFRQIGRFNLSNALGVLGCLVARGLPFQDIVAVDAGSTERMIEAFRKGDGDYIHLQGPAPQQLAHDGDEDDHSRHCDQECDDRLLEPIEQAQHDGRPLELGAAPCAE